MEDPSSLPEERTAPPAPGSAVFRPAAVPGSVVFRPAAAAFRARACLPAAITLGGAGGAAVLGYGLAGPVQAGLFHGLAALAPAVALALLALDRRGAVRAGPDGIEDRRFWRTRRTAWHEITGFEVRGSLAGRAVRVHRRDGRPITLAAPVDGPAARDPAFAERLETLRTLAATYRHAPPGTRVRSSRRIRRRTALLCLLGAGPLLLAAWSPWLDPWWPGRREAASVPRPCELAGSALAGWPAPAAGGRSAAGPGARWEWDSPSGTRYCRRWAESRGSLFLSIEAFEAAPLKSASGHAAAFMALERDLGSFRPLDGPHAASGVEAQARAEASGTALMARRSNVVIRVERSSGGGAAAGGGELAEAARIAEEALVRLGLR